MNDTMLNASTGIRTHQFGLDSVSNNIANINTTGFKANDPQFKTLFSRGMDSMNSGTVTNNDFSYGVTAGSNNIVTKVGSLRKSDTDTGVAFTGKGWFVVGKNKDGKFSVSEDGYEMSDQNLFTKNGDFLLDADGYIVNSEGYYLYGVNLGKIDNSGTFTASQDPDKDVENLAKGEMKPISIPPFLSYHPVQTTELNMNVNLNKRFGFQGIVNAYTSDGVFDEVTFFGQDFNAVASSDEDMVNPTSYSEGEITVVTPDGAEKTYKYSYGDGKSSQNKFHTIGQLQYLIKRDTGLDFDLFKAANGSIDPRGILELKNNTGEDLKVKVSGKFFEKLGIVGDFDDFSKENAISGFGLKVPSYSTNVEVYDEVGSPYVLKTDYFLANGGDFKGDQQMPEVWSTRTAIYDVKTGKMLSQDAVDSALLFDKNGKSISDGVDVPFMDGSIRYTFDDSTSYQYMDSRLGKSTQDGKTKGEVKNVRINGDGIISLSFSNGETEAIGRVGLAMFANDQGLKKVGGNLFALNPVTVNGEVKLLSGDPKLVWDDKSVLKQGKVMQGYVENSNVDVATALTDLILMQRGYSMNAKAFTTGDDLIREAISLKRN